MRSNHPGAGRGAQASSIRNMLLGSCAAPALALAGAPAMAQQYAEYACTPISSGGVSCTIPDTASTSGFQELYTGPDGDNDPSPDAPDAAGYALTNNATINQSAGQFAVLGVRSRGGQGSTEPDDAGQSGAGGAVTITNAAGGVVSVGDLSFNAAAGDGLSIGLWDDGGVIYGLYAASIGGNGIDARPQTIGGGDGGKGGGGGVATAVNHGFVEVAPFGSVSDGASRVGAVAMMATSASGSGGDRDGTDGEDPQGGGAGDAKDVYATNTGILQVCSPAACEGQPSGAALSTLAAGIYAESISGHGADPTSSGGNGGLVSVTNSGEIDVVVPVDPGGAAWGIYAASHAGYAAIDSRSITVPGGPGGSSKFVAVDHSGAITLDAGDFDAPVADQIERVCADGSTCLVDETPALANQSAGILAVSLGAWGGAGKLGVAGEDGGDGGDASTNAGSSALQTTTVRLQAGSSVGVTGDNVLGVGVLLQGGGGGRSEASDTSGGDGGDTAAIDITLGAGGAISTDGDGGIGLIARTKGGAGGPASNPSGIVDFSNDAAGQGGDAGDVSLSGSASGAEQFTITTRGRRAIGVALQSLSGSGGGGSEGYSIISTGELDGGRGGAAGRVSFTNSIILDTDGRGAHGMVLQSIAGGGGDLSDQGGLIAVAGSGGAGEPGGAVEFAGYDSHISTAGDASAGLVAQSIGGGGGDVVGSLAGDGNQGASFGVYSVGGQGGDGGMGGAVLAQLNAGASIYTGGRYAYGALLQSVGGGGGNGGDVFALASRLPVVAVGGDGSVAGNGGAVTFRSGNDGGGTQTLSTAGDNAHGLLAQSIGGGGGAGGDARADAFGLGALSAVAMAGGGDSGGAGGTVTVDATNLAVVTTGMQAKGLVAHSIGGGGGAAGSASAVDVSFGLATSVGIGGQGGDGGAGGTVNFSLARTTIVTGVADDPDASVNAHGLVAQSIGGGGGVGGSGAALSYAADLPIPEADANIAIAGAAGVGGQGGGGGAGGEVDLTLGDAVVTTHGYGAHGILVHSVGGGGGDGGDGSSMAAASLLLDKIKEAIGGVLPDDGEGGEGGEEEAGGVSINASVSVSVGGTGGNGGNGGAVDLSLNAGTRVETFGPSANAVAGQSIGGGGGNGGIASPSTKKFGEGAGVVTSIAVGGRGATLGAFGGALRAELAEDAMLLTHGEGSRGLFLQTIGGGGGTSQTTSVSFTSKLTDAIVAKLGGLKAPRLKVGVGMTGGEGGSGGVVRQVDVDGAIATFGADADAVLVQTIGGGGGLGGSFGGNGVEEESGERTPLEFGLELQEIKEQIARPWALNVNVGGTGGTGGPGGNFAVASTETDDLKMPTVTGSIHTRGDFSDGVVLQSIGGGGGAGGAAVPHDSIGVLDLSMRIGGTGGTGGVGGAVGIRLEETASLATDGFGAHGVVLQSIGGGGGMGGSGSRLIANLGIDAEPEQPAPENADGVTGAVPTNENAGFDLLDPGELYGDANNALPAAVVRLGIGSSGAGGAGANAARAEANGVAGNRIRTQGFNAFGLSVQSIGGGGGMGGIGTAPLTAAEVGLETLDPDDRQVFADDFNALFRGAHLDFIAGGDGGRGGDGGPAVAQGVFDVATLGPRSLGLLVQSVGGGGGAAGIEGARLLRQGSEGTNGSGGPARLTLDAGSAVSTAGIGSHGAIVQSVAGGGGATMASLAYGSAVRRFDADLPPTEALGLAFDLALGSGGVAGTGRAGTVTLDLNAAIVTTGDYAYGAIAQAIGAGGGVASLTPAEIDRTTTTAVSSGSVTLGTATGCADLSDCSGAGLIAATVRGGAQITTTGAGARGVVVQTVQSGGGVASGFETLQRPSAGEGDAVSLSLRVEGGFPFLHTDDVSTLTHSGAVTTLGADADGVVFQMIGGGGGVLGSAGGGGATLEGRDIVTTRAPVEVVADAASYEMTVSLGHAGAAGGAQNNDLLATLGGEIATYGDFAEAAIVQSISGGGGVAGLSHDATSAAQANLSIRVGGDGVTDGVNALAQDVVDNTSVNRDLEDDIPGGELTAAISGATYATAGYAANGVVIQQIQGGGGVAASGSRSLRAVKETLGNGDQRLGLTVGGNYGGTDGGAAMTVSVGEGSTVATSGAASHGVLAQNIVGGGGLGAVGSFVRDSSGALGDNLIDVAVGGSNTTGVSNIEIFDAGKPDEDVTTPEVGDLTLTFANASVVTSGNLSTGVLAQSIAGGGGVAAAPSAGLRSLSLGATGGQAGNGGLVEFTLGGDAQNPTSVATYGFASRAFVMQSISGGGGLFAGASTGEDFTVSAAPIRLGATGDTQGKGRPVSGTFAAAAATSGDFADGVAIQSIGGGGGIADIAAAGRAPAGVDLALGQTLGQGNAGGVQATPAATGQATGIDTAGVGAYGLVVQSIGGGGGIASHQAAAASTTLTLGAASSTGPQNADLAAIRFNLVSLRPLVADSIDHVITRGDDAHAIVAQSIGGGGGIARTLGAGDAGEAVLTLGGNAQGQEARGGAAVVETFARVLTGGDRAVGIVAQSIGGGGGIASAGDIAGVRSVSLGANAEGDGSLDANDVLVEIVTDGACASDSLDKCSGTVGEGAHGIVAQSIGGGGGMAGDISLADGIRLETYDPASFADVFGGRNGRGASGEVDVEIGTILTTQGAGAYGVIAQSIAGGGGLAGFGQAAYAGRSGGGDPDRNKAGKVSVDVYKGGGVIASGENSAGIFVQSLGDDIATQSLDIYIEGTVAGGTGEFGVGLLAHGGNASNRLELTRTGVLTAASGTAIRYQGATSDADSRFTLVNDGVIDGSVEATYANGEAYFSAEGSTLSRVAAPTAAAASAGRLSAPPARLINRRGGLATGARVYEADVTNRGTMQVGETDGFSRLAIAGHLEQGARGVILADIKPLAGKGDVLAVAGDARLDGKLLVAFDALTGGAEHRVLEVEGEVTGRFERVASNLFTFAQSVDAEGLVLRADRARIAGRDGLGEAEIAAARYLERLFVAGDESFGRFFGKLDAAAGAGALGPVLTGMTLGASLAGEAATFELARDRFDALLGCDAPGSRTVGDGQSCLRMLASSRSLEQDADGGAAGYQGEVQTTGFAAERRISPQWSLSGAVGYERTNLGSGVGRGSVDGGAGFLGLAATRELGGFAFSAGAMLGYAEFDTDRVAGPFSPGAARAEHSALSLGGRLRAAWTQDFGGGYLRPTLDLDLIHVSAEGYTETGARRQSLRVAGSEATALVVTPSLEAGATQALDEGLGLRAWARVGASLSSLDAYDATARFATDLTGVTGFSNGVATAQAVGRIGAGVSLLSGDTLDVGLRYEGAFADGYSGHTGSINIAVRF